MELPNDWLPTQEEIDQIRDEMEADCDPRLDFVVKTGEDYSDDKAYIKFLEEENQELGRTVIEDRTILVDVYSKIKEYLDRD